MLPVRPERQYRLMSTLLIPSQERRFETDHYVEGYATTFDTAYMLGQAGDVKYYEIIDRNALTGADMSDVIMQYNHEGKVLARLSNNTLLLEPNEKGLFIAADLSRSFAAQELHNEIQAGLITQMSWAFTVSEETYNRDSHTWTIQKIRKVYDVSAVSIPANDGTVISARSKIDGVIEMEQLELAERAKQIELAKRRYFYLGGLL